MWVSTEGHRDENLLVRIFSLTVASRHLLWVPTSPTLSLVLNELKAMSLTQNSPHASLKAHMQNSECVVWLRWMGIPMSCSKISSLLLISLQALCCFLFMADFGSHWGFHMRDLAAMSSIFLSAEDWNILRSSASVGPEHWNMTRPWQSICHSSICGESFRGSLPGTRSLGVTLQ